MQRFNYQPPSLPWLDIRYIDDDLIIINKPSGLLSNPGIAQITHDCALTRLQDLYPDTLLVHRLDCATSGIMVFARHKLAESKLKSQFQNRQTQKTYIAVVQGQLNNQHGKITHAIAPDKNNPPKQRAVAKSEGKAATTYYQVLSQNESASLLKLKPVTGRTHQLRVHMDAIGHPILGDDFYGNAHSMQSAPRLQLHAQELGFTHPVRLKTMHFISKHGFILPYQE